MIVYVLHTTDDYQIMAVWLTNSWQQVVKAATEAIEELFEEEPITVAVNKSTDNSWELVPSVNYTGEGFFLTRKKVDSID